MQHTHETYEALIDCIGKLFAAKGRTISDDQRDAYADTLVDVDIHCVIDAIQWHMQHGDHLPAAATIRDTAQNMKRLEQPPTVPDVRSGEWASHGARDMLEAAKRRFDIKGFRVRRITHNTRAAALRKVGRNAPWFCESIKPHTNYGQRPDFD